MGQGQVKNSIRRKQVKIRNSKDTLYSIRRDAMTCYLQQGNLWSNFASKGKIFFDVECKY